MTTKPTADQVETIDTPIGRYTLRHFPGFVDTSGRFPCTYTEHWSVQGPGLRYAVGHYKTRDKAAAAARRAAAGVQADRAVFAAAQAASTTTWRLRSGVGDVLAFYGTDACQVDGELKPGDKAAFFSRGAMRTGVVEKIAKTGTVTFCYVSSTGRMTRLAIKPGERAWVRVPQ